MKNKNIINIIIVLGLFLITGCSNLSKKEYPCNAKISGDNVRSRAQVSLTSNIVMKLNNNDEVEVISQSEKKHTIGDSNCYWYHIKKDNKEGWIYGKFVDFNVASEIKEKNSPNPTIKLESFKDIDKYIKNIRTLATAEDGGLLTYYLTNKNELIPEIQGQEYRPFNAVKAFKILKDKDTKKVVFVYLEPDFSEDSYECREYYYTTDGKLRAFRAMFNTLVESSGGMIEIDNSDESVANRTITFYYDINGKKIHKKKETNVIKDNLQPDNIILAPEKYIYKTIDELINNEKIGSIISSD